MKKLIFIYNPSAGKELLKPQLADVIDIFVKAGYEVTAYPTQSYKDAYKKVKYLEEGYDLVVCSGGDGTLDEVVTGMMKRKNRIPIGYIPAGTTNDFATSLHISKNIMSAAYAAVNGTPFACDVGKFNKDVFVYVAAFGLFTDVPYQTDQTLKNLLGHAAYVLEGMKRLMNIPTYKIKVTHDGEVIEDEFMIGMVSNSNSVAGFKGLMGKKVLFDDGEFEVMLIKRPKNPIELQEIITALLIENFDTKHMYMFKAKEITFECREEIPWTLDGEFGGQHDVVKIYNKQQALQIMLESQETESEEMIEEEEN